jgi:hypothetical protein
VVSQEELEGLDLTIWYGNAPKAASLVRCNQSTIFRRSQRCLEVFGLRLKRRQGQLALLGSSLLLQMEREIHQLARLLGQHALRLEAFPSYAKSLLSPAPPGWMLGPQEAIGIQGPLSLLRERIVDAWLTDAADDLPEPLDFPAVVWPLARQPIHLSADARHPLVGETNVTLSDLLRFPLPILPKDVLPHTGGVCADLGLGTLEVASRRYDPQSWEGRTADAVSLLYSNPLHTQTFPTLAPLATEPLLTNRLALVCRADVAEHARVQDLHCLLGLRLRHLKSHCPSLEKLILLP